MAEPKGDGKLKDGPADDTGSGLMMLEDRGLGTEQAVRAEALERAIESMEFYAKRIPGSNHLSGVVLTIADRFEKYIRTGDRYIDPKSEEGRELAEAISLRESFDGASAPDTDGVVDKAERRTRGVPHRD